MRDDENARNEMYEEIERRALFSLPAEDENEPVDVVEALRGADAERAGAPDLTLGGYIAEHNRVPAFEGADGQPYTVDVEVERGDQEPDGEYVAFLVFLRWAATGAGIMDHVESDDVARGATEAEARQAAMDLSLYEVRAELDAAIERRRKELEG